MRTAVIAAALFCALMSAAHAGPRDIGFAQGCGVLWPCEPFSARANVLGHKVRQSASYEASPGGFIRGRLICARNVNAELARRGIQGTGSAVAKSFLGWGRPTGPEVGAVAVFSRGRGGHVAIVAGRDEYGRILYLNPSASRQAWQVAPSNRQPIAFRSAT